MLTYNQYGAMWGDKEPCPFCTNWHEPDTDCDHPRFDKPNIPKGEKEAWRQGYEAAKKRFKLPLQIANLIPCGMGQQTSEDFIKACEARGIKLND